MKTNFYELNVITKEIEAKIMALRTRIQDALNARLPFVVQEAQEAAIKILDAATGIKKWHPSMGISPTKYYNQFRKRNPKTGRFEKGFLRPIRW